MMNFYHKFISLRAKLGLVIGLSTFAITTILIAYTTKSARDEAIKAARENAMATAQGYAGQIKAEIEDALTASRVLAQTFAGIKADTNALSLSREGAHAILREVLQQNESFYGTFSSWEPNAFDGQDTAYVNFDAAHDASGRFIPYWFKDGDKLLFETVLGYDTDTYYTIPRDTKKEVVIDPVTYTVANERVSLITIVAPVLNGNRFYGLAGVDIATDWMQTMVKNANLYNGMAEINVVSHNGTIAATTLSDTLLGKKILDVFPEYNEQAAALQRGTGGHVLNSEYLKAYAPVQLGSSSTPWQVSIKIPADFILADANARMWQMIFISISLLALALSLILIVVQRLIKPLGAMVKVTEQVAEGDLTYREIKAGKDEVGQMNNAFGTLLNGLRKTTDFANQIGQGNLDAEFNALSEKDVLGNALLSMRASLKTISEEDSRRNWVTEGLAQFGDLLRTHNDDLKRLSETIITELVKYLGANQGGMFSLVKEDDEQYLELVATYAWERKRHRQAKIALDEGLAGQVVLERDFIYLSDVPSDYINITSGLGKANPTAILIMPLKINEDVMGVIEIASFKEMEQYQIDFVAKIGENIASTLATVKTNQTTRQLLEEARISSEEKRAAEEELLQNQEELQATQEEMQRTITELKQENSRLQEALSEGVR
jgi:methyl-accepting chemotaxis protein